jgi:hypothetical protein
MMSEWKPVRVCVDDETIAGSEPGRVIDPVWWQGDIYNGPAEYEESLRGFSEPQRLVWAILWYRAEVNNGGHDQFYSNSTGIVWKDALKGFELIGVEEVAALLLESVLRLGGHPSQDREERNRQLENTKAQFDDLDDQFYEFEKLEDLDEALMRFIRSKPQEFYFDGVVSKPVR